jgi:hypothetical protein
VVPAGALHVPASDRLLHQGYIRALRSVVVYRIRPALARPRPAPAE